MLTSSFCNKLPEPSQPDPIAVTERTRLRRRPERGCFERETVHAILDEGLVCHVGFTVDGQPFVIPTTYARVGESLYVHGAAASRMLRALERGVPVCVTVTLLDGLVLARSAFRHSMNYRSVVVLGVAHAVTDGAEKRAALEAIVNHVVPERMAAVRPPSAEEMRATLVLRVPLDEVSAKVRSGPPHDLDEDVALSCWAGELPLRLAALSPVVAPDCIRGLAPPAAITPYGRAGA